MKKIVAIGGGELKDLETMEIDKEIVRLSGKKHPKALFIPTASSDAEGYWKTFQKVYGKKLGCKTEVLYLIRKKLARKVIKDKILSSDLIYVGGGNTLKMMNLWRRLGVDKFLKAAYNKGIVLSGLSAGSLCWFKYGHTDSMSFYNPKDWSYIRIGGLGFINAIHCPHYNSRGRAKKFQKMVKKYGGLGIAIDNNAALEFIGNKYRVLTSKKKAGAYRIYKRNGKIVKETIEKKEELAPTTKILFR